MTLFHAVILGALEGLTEFLPISSTGHLILAMRLLRLPATPFQTTFAVSIQLGAILAVLVDAWRALVTDRAVLARILAAFLPTAVIGFLAYRVVTGVFFASTDVTLGALFVGGIVLIAIDYCHPEVRRHDDRWGTWRRHEGRSLSTLPIASAALIGLIQSLSIIPGVSRAAATIIGGLLLGLSRKDAVRFSFFLAIPTMAAATGLDLLRTPIAFTADELMLLVTGFVTAFIVALFTVRWFVRYVESHTFVPFGVYRIILAGVLWFVF